MSAEGPPGLRWEVLAEERVEVVVDEPCGLERVPRREVVGPVAGPETAPTTWPPGPLGAAAGVVGLVAPRQVSIARRPEPGRSEVEAPPTTVVIQGPHLCLLAPVVLQLTV